MQTIQLNQPYIFPKMGTSGLRLVREEFDQPHFLDQLVQGLANYYNSRFPAELRELGQNTLILGGDPRVGNPERIRKVAEILAGNGIKCIVARGGLATTPALSAAIITYQAMGAVILTASHNPASDVGLKVNMPWQDESGQKSAGPALPFMTDPIIDMANQVQQIQCLEYSEAMVQGLILEENLIQAYVHFMQQIFDIALISKGFQGQPFRLLADPMHGASGPFVRALAEAFKIQVSFLNETPDPYFGPEDEHRHPEPEPRYLEDMIRHAGDFHLACGYDGDGDRNLHYVGQRNITSADVAALLAEYLDLIPLKRSFFADRPVIMGRSVVSGRQADLVVARKADAMRMKVTPTGFKFIAEVGNFGFEESNGHGNPWHGEKDGAFATMFLLTVMAKTQKTLPELLDEIYTRDGRDYFTRGGLSVPKAQRPEVEARIEKLINEKPDHIGGLALKKAWVFDYTSPAGEVTQKAAYQFNFVTEDNLDLLLNMRFSGTGTGDPYLRIYMDVIRAEIDLNLDKALRFTQKVAEEIIGRSVELPELDFIAFRD